MAPKSIRQAGTSTSTNGKPKGVLLSASDIINSAQSGLRRVEIPEITVDGEPGYVFVKPLTSRMVVEFLSAGQDANGAPDPEAQNLAMLRTMTHTVCDEDGNLLFHSTEDAEALRDMRMSVFNRISAAIMAEIGMAAEAGKAAFAAAGEGTGVSPSV